MAAYFWHYSEVTGEIVSNNGLISVQNYIPACKLIFFVLETSSAISKMDIVFRHSVLLKEKVVVLHVFNIYNTPLSSSQQQTNNDGKDVLFFLILLSISTYSAWVWVHVLGMEMCSRCQILHAGLG